MLSDPNRCSAPILSRSVAAQTQLRGGPISQRPDLGELHIQVSAGAVRFLLAAPGDACLSSSRLLFCCWFPWMLRAEMRS